MKSCRRENESVQSRYRLLMISLGDFVQGTHWQLERTSLSTLITEVSKVSYFFSPVSSTHPTHGVCLLASPHSPIFVETKDPTEVVEEVGDDKKNEDDVVAAEVC